MATMKVLGGKRSGYLTPDPFVLSQIDTSGNTKDAGMDVPAESGCETPKFVREVNVEDLQRKLENLQTEKEQSLGYISMGPPPGLSNNSLDTEAMKVIMRSNLQPPYPAFGAVPPPPVPEFQFARDDKVKQVKPMKSTMLSDQVVSKGSVGHPLKCAPACRYVKRKGGCREGANCLSCHHCFWSKAHTTKGEEESLAQSQGEDARIQEAKTLANKLVSLLGGEEPFGANAQEAVKPETSLGTMGHPHTCGEACKYVNRKGGCMYGKAFTNCHACLWSRTSVPKAEAKAPSFFGTSYGAAAQGGATQAGWQPASAMNLDALIVDPYAAPVLSTNPGWGQAQAFPNPQGEPKQVPWCASVGSMGHPYNCAPACRSEERR